MDSRNNLPALQRTSAPSSPLASSPPLSPSQSNAPAAITRPPFQRNGAHAGSPAGSQGSFPLSSSTGSSSAAPDVPNPTIHVTSMGSRTSAPPGTPIVPAPLAIIRKHSTIRGCYGVSLETSDAQRGPEPDVRLETRDSPIDATVYLHGMRGGRNADAARKARLDIRTASTVRLRIQRDENVSVDASVATTKSRIHLWLPNDFDGLLTVHSRKHTLSPCIKDIAIAHDIPGQTSHTWAICLKKDTTDPVLYRTASNSIPAEAGGQVGRERRPSATASDAIPPQPHQKQPGPDRVFAHAHSSVRVYAHIDEEEGSKCVIM